MTGKITFIYLFTLYSRNMISETNSRLQTQTDKPKMKYLNISGSDSCLSKFIVAQINELTSSTTEPKHAFVELFTYYY